MSKTSNARRKGLAVLATSALVAGASLAGAGSAHAVADFKFKRLGGTDRYETASLVADEFAATNKTVILANGEPGNYADALSANTLAGELSAPILLTRTDKTPKFTLDQLKEDGVTDIYVVGGEGVVSAAQVSSLEGMGYKVTRVAGSDRFLTNAEVIKRNGTAKGATGLIATGFNFPDALAAGPISYQGHPLGLSATNNIEDSVVNALKAAGVTKVLIFGGESVVGPGVVAKLAANDITVEKRFAGADRSDTSQAAAEYALANLGFSDKHLGVASGYVQGFGADALAGGPLEGKEMAPMLVTRDVNNPDDVVDYMKDHANTLETGHLFGGTGAISASAQAAMEKAAQSVTSNQDFTVDQTAATNVVSSPDDTTDDRQYAVTGLDNTKTYKIALAPAETVTVGSNGEVTFQDTADNGEADSLGDTDAAITVVNGSSRGSDTSADDGIVAVSPVNGQITFTVDYDGANTTESIRPVIWLDDTATAGNTADALDLNAANQPVELFAVGGQKSWVPTEAAGGAFGVDVVQVDKAGNSFVGDDLTGGTDGPATNDGTFFYDTNDTFSVDGVPSTLAQFEANLSTGDDVRGTYAPDPAASSTFNLTDTTPSAPQTVTTSQTGGKVTINWADPTEGDPDSYNIYRAVDTDDVDNGTGTDPATTDGTGCPAAGSSAWTLVKSVAGTANSTTDAPASADTYCYAVTAVVDGDESAKSNASDVTIPQPAETVRPTITDAIVSTDTGLQDVVNAGDIVKLTFSENMNASTADGQFVLVDSDGDRFTVDCEAAGATCVLGPDASSNADRVLTVTVQTAVTDANAAGDGVLEWPATIVTTDADVADEAGNIVNLASSPDVLIDKE